MAGDTEDEIPETGAVFTFGKSKFADNVPSKFWLKNDVPLKLACGDEHTALITAIGKLFMFGSNNWGQLGLGEKISVNKPTCVKALKSEKVQLVACGRTHTLVYTSCGNLYAAGGNNEGQLGLGDFVERTSFQLVEFFTKRGPIKMLAAGSNTSAAILQDGKLYVWGDNSEGQIGLGREEGTPTPRELYVGRRVTWISCGYYHSAFVTEDGALFTFGERDSGKLGLSTTRVLNHRVPQQVEGICERVLQVACGGGHTLALAEKHLYSFGLGQFGQLGHGTFVFESSLPRVVEHFRKGRVKHIACGENHSAVLTESGLLYTFGDGRHGKLALGEEYFANQFKPTLCPRFLKYNVQDVTCGGCHMLVLAKPRLKRSEDMIVEDDDVTEDHLEKLLREAESRCGLNRSLSARERRRERQRSPEQFGMMFRTLPPLSSGHLNVSLPASGQTLPSQLNKRTMNGFQRNGLLSRTGKVTEEHEVEGKTPDENYEDNESVKDLGETSDLLNLTHVMKMDPGEKTITLSPVQKKKVKAGGKRSKEVERLIQDSAPDNGWAGLSSSKAQPTELLRSASGKSQFGEHQRPSIPYQSSQSWDSDKGNAMKESSLIRHTVRKRRAKTESQTKSKSKPDSQRQLIGFKPKARAQPGQEDVCKSEVKAHPSNIKGEKESEEEVYESEEKANHFRQGDLDKSGSEKRSVNKRHGQAIKERRQELPGEFSAQITEVKRIPAESESKAVKVKSKPIVVQSKLLDSTTEHDVKTWDGCTSSEQYKQEHVPTKKTQSAKPEPNMDSQKKTNGVVLDFKAAASATDSISSQSEHTLPRSLMEVSSLTEDLPVESPVRLLKKGASSQFLSQAASINSSQSSGQSPNTLDKETLSNAASISEDPEKNVSKRTAVTINVMPVLAASDEEPKKSMSQYQSEEKVEDKGGESARDEIGQLSQEEEEDNESRGLTDSERLAKGRDKSSSVEYGKEGSKSVGQVTNDDGEAQDETNWSMSSEGEETGGEEKEEKSKTASEQGKDCETEPEEETSSHVLEEGVDEELSEAQNVEQEEEESRMSYREEESRRESGREMESRGSETEEEEGEEESKSSKSESVSAAKEEHGEGDESEEEEEENSSEEEKGFIGKEKNEGEDEEESGNESEAEGDTVEGGSEKDQQESGTEEQESEEGEKESEKEEESEAGKEEREEEREEESKAGKNEIEEESEVGKEESEEEEEESEAGKEESEAEEEESEAGKEESKAEEEESEAEEEESEAEEEESETGKEESEAGKEESEEEEEESEAEEEESEAGKEESEAEEEESEEEEEESEAGKEESEAEEEESEAGKEESEEEEEESEEEEEESEAGKEESEEEEEESEAGKEESEAEEEESEAEEEESEAGKEESEAGEEESEAGEEESEAEEEESEAEEEESEAEEEESEAEEEESEAGKEESEAEEEESEAGKEESEAEEEESEAGKEESEAEEEGMERETEKEGEDSEGEGKESGDGEEESGEEEGGEDNEAEEDVAESEQNEDNENEAGKSKEESEEEKEEEEGGERSGEHEDKEEGDQEDKDEEENEQEAVEEEENKKKRKGNEKQSKFQHGRKRSESQEPRQFWDDVLPQYLNLK
ncbi:retinitis pigmentosa GTPase regulator b isoform X1 [Ictalurus punctatus]|uniref:X-linked retinitis pigmentosa GTPase regulator n=1 Tax=Ictalurus punctatus TaxID=7998 RepID=A0A9F7QZX5_ICTPU|nr:retinitis pigmentosa GTPase regulator b isoform X1 [Ictalurus punctatus]